MKKKKNLTVANTVINSQFLDVYYYYYAAVMIVYIFFKDDDVSMTDGEKSDCVRFVSYCHHHQCLFDNTRIP